MSKTLSENILSFSERIVKILKDKGLIKKNGQVNYSEAERKCGMKGTVLQKAVKRNGGLYDDNLDKFLRTFQVRRDWLLKGTGDIYDKNGTYVEIPTPMDKKEDALNSQADEVLRQLIKGDGEYIIINKKLILEKYRLVSMEEMEQQKKESQHKHDEILKELEERKNQIHGLYKIISEITKKIPDSGSSKIPEIDKAQ